MTGRPSRTRRALACTLGTAAAYAGLGLVAPPAHAATIRAQQWYLDTWRIAEAWQVSRGVGVTVAVVDTGVDATHPDLAGQIVDAPFGTGDDQGHGTGMASLIVGTGAGAGGQGVSGVAPGAKVLSYRVTLAEAATVLDINKAAEAVRSAADSEARIINLSIGSPGVNPFMAEAVQYAQDRGKIVFAAAGNLENGATVSVKDYPAGHPGVVGVSAVKEDGRTREDSNLGPWVSLAAPGANLPRACVSATRYCASNGSSGATALASGVAALVWAAHPDWTANQVIRRLIENTSTAPGEPIPNDQVGYGIVSPRRALNSTAPPGPPDLNPLLGVRGDKPTPPPTAPPTSAAPSTAAAPATGTAPGASGTATASPPDAKPSGAGSGLGSLPARASEGGAAVGTGSGSGSSGPGTVFGIVGSVVGGILLVLLIVYLHMRSRRDHGPPRSGPPGGFANHPF